MASTSSLASNSSSVPAAATHFTYKRADAGPVDFGPLHWAQYDPLCGGNRQSPIDIREATYNATLTPLRANWRTVPGSLVNNGHTIQVNLDTSGNGLGNITGGPLQYQYELVQFHVHYSSEHQFSGTSYPLELHIVASNTYYSAQSDPSLELAVVAVFFREGLGTTTNTNTFFDPVIRGLATLNTTNVVPVTVDMVELGQLLSSVDYYTYKGSLTAPDCRETVDWLVMDNVLDISGVQLDAIRAQIEMNTRPIQPLNGRMVQTTKASMWTEWSPCEGGTQVRVCVGRLVGCNGPTVQTCS